MVEIFKEPNGVRLPTAPPNTMLTVEICEVEFKVTAPETSSALLNVMPVGPVKLLVVTDNEFNAVVFPTAPANETLPPALAIKLNAPLTVFPNVIFPELLVKV